MNPESHFGVCCPVISVAKNRATIFVTNDHICIPLVGLVSVSFVNKYTHSEKPEENLLLKTFTSGLAEWLRTMTDIDILPNIFLFYSLL